MKLKKSKKFRFFGEERFKIIDNSLNARPFVNLEKKLKSTKNLIMEFSGGGIKGVMSAYQASVLELEYYEIIHQKIKELWGCSTGGIISAMWNLGIYLEKKNKENKWTFKDILKWYIEEGPIVFEERFLNGGIGPLYDTSKIEKLFKDNFNHITFKELYDITNITLNIRVVNASKNKPEVWNYITKSDYEVWAAIRATMSAPVFFPIFKYRGEELADGGCGMYGCNAISAYKKAIEENNLTTKDFYLLSFGTGIKKIGKIGDNKISNIKWFLDYSSSESTIEQETKLEVYKEKYGLRYCRWNINLPDTLISMDKTDNIDELISLIDK